MARTVLIVDDVAFVRKTLTDILSRAHYHIVGEAQDGAEAVELYRRLQPDLVTMDVVMPRMSGIEAARKIVLMDKDAKVVMVSAMGQENLVMEAITAGARDYIPQFSKVGPDHFVAEHDPIEQLLAGSPT